MSNVDHSTRAHALLSASGASRWLACTPSARLDEQYEDTESDYAAEGTLAHEYAELLLMKQCGMVEDDAKWEQDMVAVKGHRLWKQEMVREVDKHVVFVMETLADYKAKDPEAYILLERKVDYSQWVPEGFGTGDVTIISPGLSLLHIIDLKYGKGIKVYAIQNSQLKLYAAGSYWDIELLHDVETVYMSISQPRLNHMDTWNMSTRALLTWLEVEVQPKAKLAFEGQGILVAGEHCRWCAHKPRCRVLLQENLTIAKHEFAQPEALSDQELVEALSKIEDLHAWLKGVKDYMYKQALIGRNWPGMKLVTGISRRKFADDKAVIKKLRSLGFKKKDFTKEKLAGISHIADLMTKDEFDKHLTGLIVKPEGAPTLVPADDPRQDMRNTAADDFATPFD